MNWRCCRHCQHACTWSVYVPSVEIDTEGFQVEPSRETAWLAMPEVASEEFAVAVTGEIYQPLAPLGAAGDRDTPGMGGVRSTWMVMGARVVVLPALSVTRPCRLYVPSIEMVRLDIQVLPSSETIWLATPEVASVPCDR